MQEQAQSLQPHSVGQQRSQKSPSVRKTTVKHCTHTHFLTWEGSKPSHAEAGGGDVPRPCSESGSEGNDSSSTSSEQGVPGGASGELGIPSKTDEASERPLCGSTGSLRSSSPRFTASLSGGSSTAAASPAVGESITGKGVVDTAGGGSHRPVSTTSSLWRGAYGETCLRLPGAVDPCCSRWPDAEGRAGEGRELRRGRGALPNPNDSTCG